MYAAQNPGMQQGGAGANMQAEGGAPAEAPQQQGEQQEGQPQQEETVKQETKEVEAPDTKEEQTIKQKFK